MTIDNFPNFVGYRIAGARDDAGPQRSVKYDYLLAGNGLFVSAVRREFEVCLLLRALEIEGLPEITPHIVWHVPPVPADIWHELFALIKTQRLRESEFREQVFILRHDAATGWRCAAIGRDRRRGSAIADDTHPDYRDACVEIHTHPPGAFHFSAQDDRDESGKFRFFGIISNLESGDPAVRFRCGVHDHFFQMPAAAVAGENLPVSVLDLNLLDYFRVAQSR